MDINALALWSARIRYHTEISSLYHLRMARHYFILSKTLKIIQSVFGTSSFAFLFVKNPGSIDIQFFIDFGEYYSFLAVTIGILTTIDLIIGVSDKANKHDVLGRLFSDIISDLNTFEQSEDSLKKLQEKHDKLSAQEPPEEMSYLVAKCRNESLINRAMGSEYQITFGGIQKLLSMFENFTNIGASNLRPDKHLSESPKKFIEAYGAHIVTSR